MSESIDMAQGYLGTPGSGSGNARECDGFSAADHLRAADVFLQNAFRHLDGVEFPPSVASVLAGVHQKVAGAREQIMRAQAFAGGWE